MPGKAREACLKFGQLKDSIQTGQWGQTVQQIIYETKHGKSEGLCLASPQVSKEGVSVLSKKRKFGSLQ